MCKSMKGLRIFGLLFGRVDLISISLILEGKDVGHNICKNLKMTPQTSLTSMPNIRNRSVRSELVVNWLNDDIFRMCSTSVLPVVHCGVLY